MIEKIFITEENCNLILEYFEKDKPPYIGFDTETTGLSIILDKAFLVIVGWKGRVFAFYPSSKTFEILNTLFQKANMVFAHNCKFDLHMIVNSGFDYDLYKIKWSDTMILARLVLDCDEENQSLALKTLAKKYVDKHAGDDEKIVKSELMALNKKNRNILNGMLKERHNLSLKEFEKICDDIEQGFETLPKDVQETYKIWEKDFGEARYCDINREILIQYAYNDVIIMCALIEKFIPIIKQRNQVKVLLRENACILPFYEQERVGFKLDINYLEETRKKLQNYIKEQREKFYKIAKRKVNIGQHAELKKVYKENWNVDLPSVSKTELPFHINSMPKEAKEFTNLLLELRSLEKWYSTYIIKLLKGNVNGKIYTQIQQVGTVSGRISSDFQQFPKEPLYDDLGNELFVVRKAMIPSGDIYNKVYCID